MSTGYSKVDGCMYSGVESQDEGIQDSVSMLNIAALVQEYNVTMLESRDRWKSLSNVFDVCELRNGGEPFWCVCCVQFCGVRSGRKTEWDTWLCDGCSDR